MINSKVKNDNYGVLPNQWLVSSAIALTPDVAQLVPTLCDRNNAFEHITIVLF